MLSPTVERMVEEAKRLGPEERRQLLDELQGLVPEIVVRTSGDDWDDTCMKEAMVITVPSREMSVEEYRAWQPVEIKGKPLSETIIEERR